MWQIGWDDPRSTWSHCGSLKALDQRVVVSPSTAAEAGVVAFSTEDAVAGLPWDNRVEAAAAAWPGGANGAPVTRAVSMTKAATRAGRTRGRPGRRSTLG